MIDLVDLRLTRPPDALRPVTSSNVSNGRLKSDFYSPTTTGAAYFDIENKSRDIIKPAPSNNTKPVAVERAVSLVSGEMHSMMINFCSAEDSKMKLDVDLYQYAIDSGKVVTNATVQELCAVQPGLTRLNLGSCGEVSDVGLWAIARHCTHLRDLSVSRCSQMSHIGLRSLSLRCFQVTALDLSHCPLLDDIALTVIASGCWHLERLCLRGCTGITDTGVGKVAKASDRLKFLDLNGYIELPPTLICSYTGD
jgi:hypothetical protein